MPVGTDLVFAPLDWSTLVGRPHTRAHLLRSLLPDVPISEDMLLEARQGLVLQVSDDPQPVGNECQPRAPSSETETFLASEIPKLLARGVIEPCSGPKAISPMHAVPKPHTDPPEFRLIVDMRAVNSRLPQPPSFRLQVLTEIAVSVSGPAWAITLDLASAFYEITLSPARARGQPFSGPARPTSSLDHQWAARTPRRTCSA